MPLAMPPRAGSDPLAEQVMNFFAPVSLGIGLHWHHFDQAILPPIIDTPEPPKSIQKNKIIVYLPFEDQTSIIRLLSRFKDFVFHIYSPVVAPSQYGHLICKSLSRDGFQKDLYDCEGIISNAGFELASESLQLGKKILAKPLHAQMEQISNAAALQQLGYGQTMNELDTNIIESWLHNSSAVRITYPNIAQAIVQWIQEGMQPIDLQWTSSIWDTVEVIRVK